VLTCELVFFYFQSKNFRYIISILLLQLFSWLWFVAPVVAANANKDTSPPRILHEVVVHATFGTQIEIIAKFQDESPIFEPKILFRRVGELEYTPLDLKSKADGRWHGMIPAVFVTRDIEYFLEAFDVWGNGPSRHGSPEKPHLIKVSAQNEASQQGIGPKLITPEQSISGENPTLNINDVPAVHAETKSDSITKKWWFWTILVVVAGGTTFGVLCGLHTQGLCAAHGMGTPLTQVTLRLSGPDVRDGL